MCLYQVDLERRRRATAERPRGLAASAPEGPAVVHRPAAPRLQPVLQRVLAVMCAGYGGAWRVLGRLRAAASAPPVVRLGPGAR